MEKNEGLGFAARILTSFAPRAVVSREYGRRSRTSVEALMRKIWGYAATQYGHDVGQERVCTFTSRGEQFFNEAYHRIADIETEGRWRSASKALLGKFEYWGPAVALLTEVCAQGMEQQPRASNEIRDCALKCALRFFDLRLAIGCVVTDSEVQTHTEAFAATRPIHAQAVVRDP